MNGFIAFWDGLGPHRLFFILLVLSFLGHVFFLIFRYRVLSGRGKKEEGREPEGVSVIITSSNKADLLRQNLEYFLRQDYPCFEVVVVDECSEDDTKEVLSDFQERYPNLKTSRIPPETKFRQTKKIAIHIGVLAAQYDVLLFSEIECRPASDQWIRTMASAFGERTAVVLGMANYVEAKGTGLRRYFRFLRFWQMCLLSRLGVHVMADGCNMGYRKKYYLEARGYTENTQSYMGYDSDMVKKLSRKGKVEIVKDAASFVVLDETGRRAWKSDYVYHYVQRRGSIMNEKGLLALDMEIVYEMRRAFEYQEKALQQAYPDAGMSNQQNFFNTDMLIIYTMLFFVKRQEIDHYPLPYLNLKGLPLFSRLTYRCWLGCAKLKFGKRLRICGQASYQ